MSTIARIVCLANAHKDGERCLAGKRMLPDGSMGEWIRPVSSRSKSGALSKPERIYLDREEPALLDLIEIRLDHHRPEAHQQENWLLAQDNQCKKIDALPLERLIVDAPSTIWDNGYSSDGHRDNRIPQERADRLENSLLLIEVDGMEVTRGKSLRGRPNLSGWFEYGPLGHNYKFTITDPAFEAKRSNKADKFWIETCYLTISLTDVHEQDGYAYKLIAGVIEKP